MSQGRFFAVALSTAMAMAITAPSAASVRPNLGFDRVGQLLIGDCRGVDRPQVSRDMECKHLRMGLSQDMMTSCAPDPAVVFSSEAYGGVDAPLPQYILGWQVHNLLPLDYRHTFYRSPRGELVIGIRIYFDGEPATRLEEMIAIDRRLAEAEQIWERNAPLPGLRFRFVRETDRSKAHYAVNYVMGPSRGPYIFTWSAQWTGHTFAHEIGHFMGLHDEYAEFDQDHPERHCAATSLMCDSWHGTPLRYHYYLVLRRALCSHTDPV